MKPNEFACNNLVLIPTQIELDCISRNPLQDRQVGQIELCGFGPIVAAARTMQLISRRTPKSVLLVGVAGSYEMNQEIGRAVEFKHVACHGVGVGQGGEFLPASDMGWKQWTGDEQTPEISDAIELSGPASDRVLLTVCSGAKNQSDVEHRKQLFENTVAEDMEGFGVATACRLAGVPLRIIRGISNFAGDRNLANWKIDEAMNAAWQMAVETVQS